MTGLAPAPQGLFDKCQESAEVSPAPVLAARSEESRIVHQGLNRGRGGGGGTLVTERLESLGLPATSSGLTALDVQAAYLPDGFRQLKASLHLSDCSCLLCCFKT